MMVLKMVNILRTVMIVTPRVVVIMTVRAANQHNTQLNKMMSLKVMPQLTQKTPRYSNNKKFIQMRKLTQMRRKNSKQRKFHQHNDLGQSGN